MGKARRGAADLTSELEAGRDDQNRLEWELFREVSSGDVVIWRDYPVLFDGFGALQGSVRAANETARKAQVFATSGIY